MTWQNPPTYGKILKIPLPPVISKHYLNIAMFMDLFFVNGLILFHTRSHKIDCLSAQHCNSKSINTILEKLETLKHKYTSKSFVIIDYHAGNEFDKAAITYSLQPASLHIYGRNEQIVAIERPTRTIKEQCQYVCHLVPFKIFTKLVVICLVEVVIHWVHSFPSETGASKTMLQATIVEGKPKPDFNNNMIAFGAYALVYTGTDNTMKIRATLSIALQPSNNA